MLRLLRHPLLPCDRLGMQTSRFKAKSYYPFDRVRCSAVQFPVRVVKSGTVQQDRVLLASMGIISGGLAVTACMARSSSLHNGESLLASFQRCYYHPDDTWWGQLQHSFQTIHRRIGNELEDENKQVIAGIIAANTVMWGIWRISFRSPTLHRFMWRHFACSYTAIADGKRFHTIITSAFSHITIPHLVINMIMLWEFGPLLINRRDSLSSWIDSTLTHSRVIDFLRTYTLSKSQPRLDMNEFVTLYTTSAIASSIFSIVASRVRQTPNVFTIGASGAVMGVLTMYCLLFPHQTMQLYGVVELTAAEVLQLTTVVNAIGSLFQHGLHIDFIGHLGGQWMGWLLYQQRQEPRALT